MVTRHSPLPDGFYRRPTLELAQALLDCLLGKETDEGLASGFIVETEAYIGPDDRAAHSCGNRRTKRTEIMFGEPGRVYTYVMHTHTLINVVSGTVNHPEAILIRAVEPFEGQDLMAVRRGGRTKREWTNGPGKLTAALGITRLDYGRRFTEPPLYIAKGFHPDKMTAGPRMGIDHTGEARFYPWRFTISGNPYVSK